MALISKSTKIKKKSGFYAQDFSALDRVIHFWVFWKTKADALLVEKILNLEKVEIGWKKIATTPISYLHRIPIAILYFRAQGVAQSAKDNNLPTAVKQNPLSPSFQKWIPISFLISAVYRLKLIDIPYSIYFAWMKTLTKDPKTLKNWSSGKCLTFLGPGIYPFCLNC